MKKNNEEEKTHEGWLIFIYLTAMFLMVLDYIGLL